MHLIVMSCSAKKVDSPIPMPAFDLYSGVFFSILKKHFLVYPKAAQNTKVVIISAKYGLIEANELISKYDLKMTKSIAARQFEHNTKLLTDIVDKYSPTSITVVMGHTYRCSVNLLKIGIPIASISGPIGIMLHDFKNWLIKQAGESNAC